MFSFPARGHVYRVDLGYGAKPWLVVSNNARNRVLFTVLAVRVTTIAKPLPTWVSLTPADPLTGHVVVDDLEQLAGDELGEHLGALAPASILRVNEALKLVLGIA